jgi:hypothetical protein
MGEHRLYQLGQIEAVRKTYSQYSGRTRFAAEAAGAEPSRSAKKLNLSAGDNCKPPVGCVGWRSTRSVSVVNSRVIVATPERARLPALFAELGRSDPRTLWAILRMNEKTPCLSRVPGAASPTGTDVPRRLACQPDQQRKPAYDLHITIASAAPGRQRPYRVQR